MFFIVPVVLFFELNYYSKIGKFFLGGVGGREQK